MSKREDERLQNLIVRHPAARIFQDSTDWFLTSKRLSSAGKIWETRRGPLRRLPNGLWAVPALVASSWKPREPAAVGVPTWWISKETVWQEANTWSIYKQVIKGAADLVARILKGA